LFLSLDNRGTVDINESAGLGHAGAKHQNAGSFIVARMVNLFGPTSTLPQNTFCAILTKLRRADGYDVDQLLRLRTENQVLRETLGKRRLTILACRSTGAQ